MVPLSNDLQRLHQAVTEFQRFSGGSSLVGLIFAGGADEAEMFVSVRSKIELFSFLMLFV